MGDLSYCAYLRSLPKPCSFCLSSSSDPSCTFCFFIVCFPLQSLAICLFLLYLKHVHVSLSFFFCSAFFCHIAVLVAVEALGLPIFEVIVGLPNVHWLFLSSINCSCASLVVMFSFHGFVSLFYWYDCYFLLLECLGYCYRWIIQYCLDNVMSNILL